MDRRSLLRMFLAVPFAPLAVQRLPDRAAFARTYAACIARPDDNELIFDPKYWEYSGPEFIEEVGLNEC